MAGGEFRFGTASIYMAQRDNIQPNRTSQMRVTTWTRFRRPQRHFLSTSAAFIVSARGKLGLGPIVLTLISRRQLSYVPTRNHAFSIVTDCCLYESHCL